MAKWGACFGLLPCKSVSRITTVLVNVVLRAGTYNSDVETLRSWGELQIISVNTKVSSRCWCLTSILGEFPFHNINRNGSRLLRFPWLLLRYVMLAEQVDGTAPSQTLKHFTETTLICFFCSLETISCKTLQVGRGSTMTDSSYIGHFRVTSNIKRLEYSEHLLIVKVREDRFRLLVKSDRW